MKEKAETNKTIQTPNQKDCQNPPDSTTVVITAEKIQSIPVTTKPTSFAIVVASGNRGTRWSIAGGSEIIIFMTDTGMQVVGHTLTGIITYWYSAYYIDMPFDVNQG